MGNLHHFQGTGWLIYLASSRPHIKVVQTRRLPHALTVAAMLVFTPCIELEKMLKIGFVNVETCCHILHYIHIQKVVAVANIDEKVAFEWRQKLLSKFLSDRSHGMFNEENFMLVMRVAKYLAADLEPHTVA